MHGPYGVSVRSGCLLLCALAVAAAADQVKVEGGVLEGITSADSAVRISRACLSPRRRWALSAGKRRSRGPVDGRPQGGSIWSPVLPGQHLLDMIFRDKGISEDCLYLNVWTPSPAKKRLPVLVYFHGGGFAAGSGDEPRYDGTNFAKKGIIVVTVNYRLGVFGFLAHPELTAESPHKASGNYGMLDQVAALQWSSATSPRLEAIPPK